MISMKKETDLHSMEAYIQAFGKILEISQVFWNNALFLPVLWRKKASGSIWKHIARQSSRFGRLSWARTTPCLRRLFLASGRRARVSNGRADQYVAGQGCTSRPWCFRGRRGEEGEGVLPFWECLMKGWCFMSISGVQVC